MARSTPPKSSAYETLKSRWHEAARFEEIAGLLHWDQAVLMPQGGARARADQLSVLATQAHHLRTQADTQKLLDAAADEDLDPWDRRNLSLMRDAWRKQALVPAALVETLTTTAQAAEIAWGQARDADDFALVRPALQASFAATRQRAQLLSDALDQDPYDVLLDDFEPGLTQALIDPVFADYAAFLPDFLAAVQAKQANEPDVLRPTGPFPVDTQETLGRDLMGCLGFDFTKGRLDVSRHPFCGGHPADIRMTTRYDPNDFTSALMGVLHETGHGLYEAGLPQAYLTQPVGAAAGLAAHESQSLLMEMQACRSDAFLGFLAAKAREAFDGRGAAWETDNLIRLYRQVRPGTIRVDADEVTYPAHVMLRYDLERALFADDLRIADLPSAFADGLAARLGVRPQSAFDGVLQDIHWYSGGFGYFPTYTLGAMAAAQFFAAAQRDMPDLDQDLSQGDFSALLGWLRTHVHGQGSFQGTQAMLVAATGRALDPACFRRHLQTRYTNGQKS